MLIRPDAHAHHVMRMLTDPDRQDARQTHRNLKGQVSANRRIEGHCPETAVLVQDPNTFDLYIDHGVSGARAARPQFDKALDALHKGDTLVITTLDRLGRSTANMLELATVLRKRGTGLHVLNLGGGDVDTGTPMGGMVFTVMAALAQMELEIERERITDSVSKRRAAGRDLGGRRERFTDSQIKCPPPDRGRPAGHPGFPGPRHVPGDPVPTHGQTPRPAVDHLPGSLSRTTQTPSAKSFTSAINGRSCSSGLEVPCSLFMKIQL